MSQEFLAIYEGGVLRPLTPLNLPESVQLTVSVREPDGASTAAPEDLQRQQTALNSMFAEVDRLPQAGGEDGLSNRDHDHVLYGSPK
jgi:predicted DNA-binding antitoxin AbrB/MazE fold protein